MIKVYLFINAVAGLELNEHAATRLQAACPGVQAALVSVAIEDAIPGRPPSFDGVLELWFESESDVCEVPLAEIFTNSVSLAHQLSGIERTVMRTAEFYQAPSVKGVYAFRRKPGMSVNEFQEYWWHYHGPIAALTESATCYIQTHMMKHTYGSTPPPFDGVTELYWPNLERALMALGSRQMTEDQANDAKNFVELDSVDLMMTHQHMIIPPWKDA